jgi:hypothetical protein
MNHYYQLSASDEMINDVPLFREYITSRFKYHLKDLQKKSLKAVPPFTVQIGYNGTDFIENKQTVVFKFNAYRIPRILKTI